LNEKASLYEFHGIKFEVENANARDVEFRIWSEPHSSDDRIPMIKQPTILSGLRTFLSMYKPLIVPTDNPGTR